MHLRLKNISASVRWLFSEYSAISRWSSPNIRRALLPTKHHQWFVKNFQSKHWKFWASGKCSRTSTTSSDYSPKVRFCLPNIAWCLSMSIGNASAMLKKPSGTEALATWRIVNITELVTLKWYMSDLETWHNWEHGTIGSIAKFVTWPN